MENLTLCFGVESICRWLLFRNACGKQPGNQVQRVSFGSGDLKGTENVLCFTWRLMSPYAQLYFPWLQSAIVNCSPKMLNGKESQESTVLSCKSYALMWVAWWHLTVLPHPTQATSDLRAACATCLLTTGWPSGLSGCSTALAVKSPLSYLITPESGRVMLAVQIRQRKAIECVL